jgi:type IV pilus assembly protein PilQ
MVSRTLMRSMLVTVALLVGIGIGAGSAAAQDDCFAQLPTDRVTLNLRDASTQTTLRLLAQQYRINMVVTEEVKGTVTLDFFKVPAREVFHAIIEAANLSCVVAGEVLRVSTGTRIKAEDVERSKLRDTQLRLEADTRLKIIEARRAEGEAAEQVARGPVREEIIRLRYADAEQVARTLQGILGLPISGQGGFSAPVPLPQLSQLYVPTPPTLIPSEPPPPQTAPGQTFPSSPEVLAKGLTVGFYKATNSVFIRYYARDLERIKKLIQESFDVPLPQIQISAQMVITTLNALQQIGVQWGAGKATAVGNGNVVVGQGFSTSPNAGGNPSAGGAITPGSQGVTPITTVPPPAAAGSIVSPATVGNLVNLSTLFLPTVASPAGGLLLGLIGQNFNISLAIQALEVQAKARTLASPKTITVENGKTVISRGFLVPFVSTPTTGVSQVQFAEANLKLEVTPRLIREEGERKIRMKVSFDNDAPDFTQTVGGNPLIFKRHQDTEVLILEGQRLVIGGVTNSVNSTTKREVPLLGKIPVLGWLFRSREISSSDEELIVILTPTVVSEPGPPPRG